MPITKATTPATVKVGNTARHVDANQWSWQMSVDPGEHAELVSKIVLHLHPTFATNTIEILSIHAADGVFKSPCFHGWGTFTVGVDIHWTGVDQLTQLEHSLVFSGGGASSELLIELPESLLPEEFPFDGAVQISPDQSMSREELQTRLATSKFPDPADAQYFHGRAFRGDLQQPRTSWQSDQKPRDDHSAPDWLTATEFEDHEQVMDQKCSMLAEMILLSNKTVVYSGAGISVASCIGQAARGSGTNKSRGLDAWPSKTHYALGTLGKHKLIHGWIQQNHDGLPQKAGFPQEHINEIHGSWFDPSNPVVLYSGNLKDDAYPSMRHDAATADLVIVVGTSLGGLNADQVATKTAHRSCRDCEWRADGTGGALGTVMINLQQTEQDGKASLRMFGTTDSILPRVLEKLGLAEASVCKCGRKFCREPNGYMYNTSPSGEHQWDLKLKGTDNVMHKAERAHFCPERVAVVPYDQEGNLSSTAWTQLDLSDGAHVKLTAGHNVQGSGQPHYMHIGASEPYTRPDAYGGQTMQPGPGHGRVHSFNQANCAYNLVIEGVMMQLGVWWLEAAKRGQLPTLPVINTNPNVMAPPVGN